MFGSDTLDVAIGLVFIYLMVSFVCSAATEFIEVIMKNRPKKLFQGISELLSHSDEWVAKIYNDPLVSSLYKGKFGETKPGDLPSYIPAKNFAIALLNQLDDSTSVDKINASVDKLFPQDARTALDTLRNNKSRTPAQDVELEALGAQEHIYKALKSALLTAEGDVNKAVKNIEDWYNSAMDRVSGWFKRRTHIVLLCLGAVAAIVYNIDTLSIVTRLANDKAVRQAIVASAGAAVKQSPTDTATDDVKAVKEKLDQSINTLFDKAGTLIGWGKDFSWECDYLRGQLWAHWLGWLLTAIAVSFGAPFWFDVLNKFMVVRSTVKPKEKSEPEKSKD